MIRLKTIDAHAAGGLLRLVVEGFPSPRGRTMADKAAWAARHADALRRVLLLEPRGHADMCGAVLTEPVSAGSHAGLLFMHAGGYVPMSGHGVIAATTIALERGLLMPGGDGGTIVFDTAAGPVRVAAAVRPGGSSGSGESGEASDVRVESVTFRSVPSFVLHGGLPVKVGSRRLRVDLAFGGAFYAIVDSEASGVGLTAQHTAGIRRSGREIADAVEAAHTIAHPDTPAITGVHGTIFTGPPQGHGADLRSIAVFGDGQIERSPGGTATCALLAVLAAMGLAPDDHAFVHEGPLGTTLRARLASRTVVAEHEAVVCEVTGAAWITGEHQLLVDETDPFPEGFRV